MGLDQYLYAERRFTPENAQPILAAAGMTLPELQRLSTADPWEEEPFFYLPRWSFHKGDANYRLSTEVHELAGTLPFATEDTGSGHLGWRDDYVYVNIACVYWRKANAIHAWFVDNCQGGVDDCGYYPVDPEALAYLRSMCVDALTAYMEEDLTKAQEILGPRAGFFFGPAEIDEWWADNTANTIAELERVIQLGVEVGGVHFSYHSSW